MTMIRAFVAEGAGRLLKNDVPNPFREAELLATLGLGKSREWVIAHPEYVLAKKQIRQIRGFFARRARGEPFAYIAGEKEFYGRAFLVNRSVLIPRPETELLVDQCLNILKAKSPDFIGDSRHGRNYKLKALVDVGAGSGCIAITLAKLFPRAQVFATDISPSALRVAKINSRRHGAAVSFLRGNLLEPLLRTKNLSKKIFDHKIGRSQKNTAVAKCEQAREAPTIVLAANLPYVSSSAFRALPNGIKNFEPKGALYGGRDGLQWYRALLPQIADLRSRTSARIFCAFEIAPSQTRALAALFKKFFPSAQISIHKNRILSAQIA